MKLPDLTPLREEIDDIDARILDLLRRRFELVLQVGEIKKAHGVKVYDPDRERRVLDELARLARHPIRPETVRRIFERIIDEARSQEKHHINEES